MSIAAVRGTVLVTGGTGSFGRTLARRLLTEADVGEVRILSRDEAKQDRFRRELGDRRARFHLGDVRDLDSVRDAVEGVDHVFHAAALKQVPSCEFFPMQAVATNVTGTANVLRAAHDCGVRSVVCLSTDKAVQPVSAMGLSKAMMEKVAQAQARNHPDSATRVAVTRYGNVLYSRGSVVPLFVEQLRRGRPMTITDAGMTRFLMSLTEAVELVAVAFADALAGDILVPKAPACTIGDLAVAVARLLGVEPRIEVIGIRHGEKRHECLLGAEEMARAVDVGAHYRIPLDGRPLDSIPCTDEGVADRPPPVGLTSDASERLDVEQVMDVLAALPEMRQVIDEARR